LSKNPKVQARVAELVGKAAKKAGVTIDRIVAEMAKVGFSDVRRALTSGEGVPPWTGAKGARLRTAPRQSEPPELDFVPETATVLPDLLYAHIRELGYSIADLASLLHVQPSELASLYGLTLTQDSRPPHLRIVK